MEYTVFTEALSHGVEYLDDSFLTVEGFQALFPDSPVRGGGVTMRTVTEEGKLGIRTFYLIDGWYEDVSLITNIINHEELHRTFNSLGEFAANRLLDELDETNRDQESASEAIGLNLPAALREIET